MKHLELCISQIVLEYYWELVDYNLKQGFLRRLRDPIRVARIENRVPRISENYHRVPTSPYRVPNIFLKKKPWLKVTGSIASEDE